MPEFASPVLSSWLPKRLQYYLFFYSFVPTVLLKLHRAVFGLVRVIVVTCYSPGPTSISFTALNTQDCDAKACPHDTLEVGRGKAGACSPGNGDISAITLY